MRNLWLVVVLSGCGTLEGSETDLLAVQCDEALTPADNTAEPYLTLEPLDDLFAVIGGEWEVELLREDDGPPGPYFGVVTASLGAGPIYAAHREFPDDRTGMDPDETCEDEYRIPIDVDLTLDGGELSLAGQHQYRLQSEPTARILYDFSDLSDSWWDPSRVQGTMDLDDPKDGVAPKSVGLSLGFERGQWTGAVEIGTETEDYKSARVMLRIVETEVTEIQ